MKKAPALRQQTGERWLLVFNCQVLGLSNSLNLLTDEVFVEHYDPAAFRKAEEEVLSRWDTFDRVLIAPQLESLLPLKYREDAKLWRIPTIYFNAYHPDICYLYQGGKSLKGIMGDYHSAIAVSAFRQGLSADTTLELFNETTYERLGYLQRWDIARERLLDAYKLAGLDLRSQFVDWSRTGAFMYSNNHVQIRCLHDLAKAILDAAGKAVAYQHPLPHDNLLNGPIYPVYPEIGRALGVPGSHLFKLGGEYRFAKLEEFIEKSFDLYERTPGMARSIDSPILIETQLA